MINLIIIINLVVFIAWRVVTGHNLEFMNENFLVSWDALAAGRVWTLITSEFSHIEFFHILINMLVLKNFGGLLVRFLSRRQFLLFYFAAAIVASLGHSVVSAFVMGNSTIPALGASGAIAGCVMMFCMMFPKEKIYIFGLIPVPAMLGAVAFVGLDLWGLMAQAHGGGLPIGHGAHLGGAFTGLIWYFLFIRKKYQRA